MRLLNLKPRARHNRPSLQVLFPALGLFILCACSTTSVPNTTDSQTNGYRTYTTNFPQTENPISESGAWMNGKTDGLDWSDAKTTKNLAFGTQVPPTGPPYNDSVALLKGTWKADQKVTATVHSVNQQGDPTYEEVELWLRGSISAHNITGYEINFRCLTGPSSYVQIHNWNGPLNDFGGLDSTTGPGLRDGDVVSASIVGNTITVSINGAQILQTQDTANQFASGNPGMGFYYEGSTGADSDYGFTNLTATDQL